MSKNYGKDFERKFKADFLATVPNSTIDRLYDPVSGYIAISNIADYIGYAFPTIFYLECKSCKGASLPFTNITQYEKLLPKVGIHGVRAGIILWLYEKDMVLYVPIATVQKMKQDGKKSVGVRSIEQGYNIKVMPSKKRRIFLDTDYSSLLVLQDGE